MKRKEKKEKKEKKVKEKKVKGEKIKGGKIKEETMIEKKSEESESKSNIFSIPIEYLEKYINRDKKEEIMDLLINSNYLRSPVDYVDIHRELCELCREGNLELIKIYLRETIKNYSGTYSFKVDKKNKTASLFQVYHFDKEIIIPRMIQLESKDYLITSVCGTNTYAKTIYFPENSAVETLYESAIPSDSNIKEIYFPPSLKELRNGWNNHADKLRKFIISPSNKHFQFIDDCYLVGKSDENNDEFDTLLFVPRDIEEFSIPSNIKIISSNVFYKCKKLTKVEIPKNSNLQVIESNAFSKSNIESIYIPSNVKIISSNVFYECEKLTKVEIPKNSNLQIIGPCAFYETNIESIFIPSTVSKICEYAFLSCEKLENVEIPKNSNLQAIESKAFSFSNIKEIYFPASLKELNPKWCNYAHNLNKIKISRSNNHFKFKRGKYLVGKSDESKDKFDVLLFVSRDIKKISIPSKIKIISSNALSESRIESVFIPSKVSKICENAFSECTRLKIIEISTNSNLQTIESNSFSFTRIESFFIPSKVSKICENAFLHCYYLKKFEIPKNSNLQIIESCAFKHSGIESFFIPSKVSKICEDAFSKCKNLKIIEISEESKLDSVSFPKKLNFIFMIPSSLKKLIQEIYTY